MKRTYTIGSFLIVLLGVIVIFMIMIATARERTKITDIQQEINALQEKADEVNRDNGTFKERVAFFGTEHFNEREAKAKLNYKKQGERVVVIKKNNDDADDHVEEETPVREEREIVPNYKKWWMEFFR